MALLYEVLLESKLPSEGDLTNMKNIKIKEGDIDYNISGIYPFDKKGWDYNPEFIYHTVGADFRKSFVKRDTFSTALALALATYFENNL